MGYGLRGRGLRGGFVKGRASRLLLKQQEVGGW